MRALDIILLFVLLLTLSLGIYVLWTNAPQQEKAYESFNANITSYHISNESQFFQNMRYRDRRISYQISDSCSKNKQEDIETAFSILDEKTILEFYPSINGEIQILCSNIAPKTEEKDHFIAGEGGPSEIINASYYYIILSGKVSLYRSEVCDTPQIAIHEILHALGFNHKIDKNSILYPITSCNQEIDSSVIEEINNLYKVDSLADLAIEKAEATKRGEYVNFNITLVNFGLKDADKSILTISTEKGAVKDLEVGKIPLGTRKEISVTNLKVSRNTNTLIFNIETTENELTLENNKIRLYPSQ